MQESLQPGAAWATDSGGSGSTHTLMSSSMNLDQGTKMILHMLRAYVMKKVNSYDSRALFLWLSRQQIPWSKGLSGVSSSNPHGPFSPLGAYIRVSVNGYFNGAKIIQPPWRTVQRFIKSPYHPVIPLLGMHLEKMKTVTKNDICTPVFIAALSTIVKTGKQPTAHRQIKKLIH